MLPSRGGAAPVPQRWLFSRSRVAPGVQKPARCAAHVCGTVWYCVALCGTVWHCVALCGTVWHCVALCGTVWHCVALCGTVWHCVALRAQAPARRPFDRLDRALVWRRSPLSPRPCSHFAAPGCYVCLRPRTRRARSVIGAPGSLRDGPAAPVPSPTYGGASVETGDAPPHEVRPGLAPSAFRAHAHALHAHAPSGWARMVGAGHAEPSNGRSRPGACAWRGQLPPARHPGLAAVRRGGGGITPARAFVPLRAPPPRTTPSRITPARPAPPRPSPHRPATLCSQASACRG
jgi:hypothetical protein